MEYELIDKHGLEQHSKPGHPAHIKFAEVLHVPPLITDIQEMVQHRGVQTPVIPSHDHACIPHCSHVITIYHIVRLSNWQPDLKVVIAPHRQVGVWLGQTAELGAYREGR